MSTEEFESLWLLIFCASLIVTFGLGAIKGGQR
ncbi:MAG: tail virion protein G7P-2 [Marinomonas foliarum]